MIIETEFVLRVNCEVMNDRRGDSCFSDTGAAL